MYQLIAYIKFLFRATNQHGVHSPFVYDFVTQCLYDKRQKDIYLNLHDYRNHLLKDETILDVLDLGEGSKTLKKHRRKISKMAKTSSSSKKNSQLLLRLAKYFNCETILELGTSLGMATYAFSLGNPASKIITIEGCPNTSDFSKARFKALHINNVEFIKGDFTAIIPTLKPPSFDLVFFDGHHNKAATIKYFETLVSKVNNETLFVFDDIYWSKGMTEAWHFIKQHHAVSVTIDCFHLGFVFFRKEQVKQHFKIRV